MNLMLDDSPASWVASPSPDSDTAAGLPPTTAYHNSYTPPACVPQPPAPHPQALTPALVPHSLAVHLVLSPSARVSLDYFPWPVARRWLRRVPRIPVHLLPQLCHLDLQLFNPLHQRIKCQHHRPHAPRRLCPVFGGYPQFSWWCRLLVHIAYCTLCLPFVSPLNGYVLFNCTTSYTPGGMPINGASAQFNRVEDFAESVAAFVYPERINDHVQKKHKGGPYYYDDVRKLPRYSFVENRVIEAARARGIGRR